MFANPLEKPLCLDTCWPCIIYKMIGRIMLLSGPKVLQESLYQTETTLQSHGQFKLTCQAEGIPSQHILWENSWLISCQLVLHKSLLIKKKKKKSCPDKTSCLNFGKSWNTELTGHRPVSSTVRTWKVSQLIGQSWWNQQVFQIGWWKLPTYGKWGSEATKHHIHKHVVHRDSLAWRL